MKNFTIILKRYRILFLGLVLLFTSSFSISEDSKSYIHKVLNSCYDIKAEQEGLRSFELKITNKGFCRYRKVFLNGKEEFFAFNLSRFKKMSYYGTTEQGELCLHTQNDDIIVQTRRDRKGDIDSMATALYIPLKNVEVEQLNELARCFNELAEKPKTN